VKLHLHVKLHVYRGELVKLHLHVKLHVYRGELVKLHLYVSSPQEARSLAFAPLFSPASACVAAWPASSGQLPSGRLHLLCLSALPRELCTWTRER